MKRFTLLLISALAWNTFAADDPALLAGRKAAKSLLDTLQPQLQSAMKSGGPAAAMQVCASVAQPLTKNLKVAHPAVKSVSRTSAKYRNPANAPDTEDAKHLAEYAKSGSKADRVVKDSRGTTYYKPMYLQAVCLNCHGSQLKPAVTALLKQHYPKDLATGYQDGDFRGLIKVELDPSKL